MSNYTIAVSWSGKDALSDSDTAKIISGGDFNTEFTAVQTAVNSKAELNGAASEAWSDPYMTGGETSTSTSESTVNMYISEKQSRSDITNIANELTRNEGLI